MTQKRQIVHKCQSRNYGDRNRTHNTTPFVEHVSPRERAFDEYMATKHGTEAALAAFERVKEHMP